MKNLQEKRNFFSNLPKLKMSEPLMKNTVTLHPHKCTTTLFKYIQHYLEGKTHNTCAHEYANAGHHQAATSRCLCSFCANASETDVYGSLWWMGVKYAEILVFM